MRYKHLPGQHPQIRHGNRGGVNVIDETNSAHEKRLLTGGITKEDVINALVSQNNSDAIIDEIKITKVWSKPPKMIFYFRVNPKIVKEQKQWQATYSLTIGEDKVVSLGHTSIYGGAQPYNKMYKNWGKSIIGLFHGKGYQYLSIPVPKPDGVFYDYKKVSLA